MPRSTNPTWRQIKILQHDYSRETHGCRTSVRIVEWNTRLKDWSAKINCSIWMVSCRPDTATYIQKMERERDAREKGDLKDNRSFIAKYVSRTVLWTSWATALRSLLMKSFFCCTCSGCTWFHCWFLYFYQVLDNQKLQLQLDNVSVCNYDFSIVSY